LGKEVFGTHDTPNTPLTADQQAQAQAFTIYKVIPYAGIEDLLVTETNQAVQRAFLAATAARADYPKQCGYLSPGASDAEVAELTRKVLIARKGTETFAPLLIAECGFGQLPPTLTGLLVDIDHRLSAAANATGPGPAAPPAQPPATAGQTAP
jgi:putative ATP-dependent endonuclease of OLD family